MKPIIDQLRNSTQVLVTTHSNPDGDAIGSLVAMEQTLAQMGKRVTMYNDSPIPAVYRFLPAVHQVQREFPINDGYDTAIVLDCGDIGRVGDAAEEVGRTPAVINIDHHVTNTEFGQLRYIDTEASATAEILWRLFKEMAAPIDRDIATAIYTGILTDTGSFRFSNTTREAFAICEEAVGMGVDPSRVAKHVYGTYSLGRIKLLNLALNSIELSPNGKLSMMILTQNMLAQTRTRPEDVDGLINYARSIEDVRIAALIQENTNGDRLKSFAHGYNISLRSDGSVDLARFAARRGGGGHANAASYSREMPLADIKAELIRLAESL